MRILFATIQHRESDFYARVGRVLERAGHDVVHLTYSREATRRNRRQGIASHCLADLMGAVSPDGHTWEEEEARIVADYDLSGLEEVYGTDPFCRGKGIDRGCAKRTVRQFLAVERLFADLRPEIVIPEVGSESPRTIADLVGRAAGATTLYLMFTMFDDPLRLYANTTDAPIVPSEELRELTAAEEAELDDFMTRFTERNRPIRKHRQVVVDRRRLRTMFRHFVVKAIWDRDNPYLRPAAWLGRDLSEKLRATIAKRAYQPLPEGPFAFFPLQVGDDYKLLRLRPECLDQAGLAIRSAEALPDGVRLVVKEHPMSVGRNPVGMLRMLAGHPRVNLVDPHQSSLDLARRSSGIITIGSTVGLESLMYGKPVLTLGRPFYSGFGVTLDVLDLAQVEASVPKLFDFEPDRDRTRRFLHAAMRHCYPGAPVLVDDSDENAVRLANTIDRAASGNLGDRRFQWAPARATVLGDGLAG